jgi:hypothetical protein
LAFSQKYAALAPNTGPRSIDHGPYRRNLDRFQERERERERGPRNTKAEPAAIIGLADLSSPRALKFSCARTFDVMRAVNVALIGGSSGASGLFSGR